MNKKLYKSVLCSNKEVSQHIYLATFKLLGGEVNILPGQFLHLLCLDFQQFHLRRPFTIFSFSTKDDRATVSILYEKVGRVTNYLSSLTLDSSYSGSFEFLMPLGIPFEIPVEGKRIVFVAGGIGIAAFGMLKEKITRDLILLYGARSKDCLIDLNLFQTPFTKVKYSTDDGSFGRKGFVSLLLEEDLKKYSRESIYYICGPTPMMANCFFLLKKYGARGYFSLENRMACALNVCRACVVKLKDKKTNSFKMATCCTDGPNFFIEQFPDTGWW